MISVTSQYSEKKFFNDSAINTILDRIYYEMVAGAGMPIEAINEVFGLTGRAALIWQNEIAATPCDNVILITSDARLYSFIQDILPSKIQNKGVIKFKERTLFNFETFFLEVWFDEQQLFILNSNGIYMQRAGAINPILR